MPSDRSSAGIRDPPTWTFDVLTALSRSIMQPTHCNTPTLYKQTNICRHGDLTSGSFLASRFCTASSAFMTQSHVEARLAAGVPCKRALARYNRQSQPPRRTTGCDCLRRCTLPPDPAISELQTRRSSSSRLMHLRVPTSRDSNTEPSAMQLQPSPGNPPFGAFAGF